MQLNKTVDNDAVLIFNLRATCNLRRTSLLRYASQLGRYFIITEAELNKIASWASIISLVISLLSLYLMGSIKSSVIESRRKTRLRQLFGEIASVPDDAVPLSTATKGKFMSLDRNLPSGRVTFWTAKSKAVREIRAAIKSENIPSIKEGIEDYKSHCEDL